MIVIDTRPANSNFIINNKVSISIICITSYYVGGKPHLFFSFLWFLLYTIFLTFQANKMKKIENHILTNMIFYFLFFYNIQSIKFSIYSIKNNGIFKILSSFFKLFIDNLMDMLLLNFSLYFVKLALLVDLLDFTSIGIILFLF